MLTIHGRRHSRASRCLWVLEEMGLPYEQVPINTQSGENKTPDYLKLNPAGKVPVLVEDGFVLRESLAINFYLVTRKETPLWPHDARTQAVIHQWSSWAGTEMEVPLNAIFREKRRAAAAEAQADAALVAANTELANKTLQLLEDHLATSPHVAGADFTLGDINAFTAAMLAPMFLDMSRFPAVQAWLARCGERPAWQRVQALP